MARSEERVARQSPNNCLRAQHAHFHSSKALSYFFSSLLVLYLFLLLSLDIHCRHTCRIVFGRNGIEEWSLCFSGLFSSLFNNCRERGLLDVFLVLLSLQDLVDVYPDSRSALTIQWEMYNIKLWPHGGSSVALLGNSSKASSRAKNSLSKKHVMSWTWNTNTCPLVLTSTPRLFESHH